MSDSNGLQSLHHILKCGSMGLSMALWSCMDGFTIQYTIFKLCHIVTHQLLTKLTKLFCKSACQCVYEVKRTGVPPTPAQQSYECISVVHASYFKINSYICQASCLKFNILQDSSRSFTKDSYLPFQSK